jgi:integrating conjugative element protein (TIGR03759 family)
MKRVKQLLVMGLALCGFYNGIALADNISTGIVQSTTQYNFSTITLTDYEKLTTAQQQTIADQWHLTASDYQNYLALMQSTPNGVYYQDKHLDPSVILGFNASNDEERKKYVLIAIQNEQARVAKELAFQKLFYQLQRTLYSHQKPIVEPAFTKKIGSDVTLESNDTLMLFINPKQASSNLLVSRLIHVVQKHPQTQLAIYFVGNQSDADIRAWASQQQIPPMLVKANSITLNHDAGHFQQFTKDQITLPYVGLMRDSGVKAIDWTTLQ